MSNIDKIANLLAMAERTDNPAEAEAFMMKAQTLATLHSVDLAVAQSKIAQREKREQPTHKQITIGERGKRANKQLIALFLAIANNNDVSMDVAHNSTFTIAFGFPSDIEVVETMWGSLAYQMVEAANAYIKAGEWKGESYIKYTTDRWGYDSREVKPHTAVTARNSFYTGFISRIGTRLAEARREAIAEADALARQNALMDAAEQQESQNAAGAELVLKGKKEEVRSYYKSASNARGSWKGYRGHAETSGHASRAGIDAASRARLSSSKGVGSRSGALAS